MVKWDTVEELKEAMAKWSDRDVLKHYRLAVVDTCAAYDREADEIDEYLIVETIIENELKRRLEK